MSQRHRTHEAAAPPKVELRAHAHNERHRINSALHAVAREVSAGSEPDDLHEPGRSWMPAHHHEPARARKATGPVKKHWKLKMWKRRTKLRMAKARAYQLAARET